MQGFFFTCQSIVSMVNELYITNTRFYDRTGILLAMNTLEE